MLAAAMHPDTATISAEASLGVSRRSQTHEIATVAVGGDSIRLARTVHTRDRRLRDRGTVSHLLAVQSALPRMIRDSRLLIVSSVMDDASLWIRRPTGEQPKGKIVRTQKGSVVRIGRNVHRTTLNVVQHVVGLKNDRPFAARVQVPSQILPRGNWSTIRHRWARWSVLCKTGVGSCLRPRRLPFQLGGCDVETAIADDRMTKVMVLTMDSAAPNKCIVAEEQQGVRNKPRACLLDIPCFHHIGALAARPIVGRLGQGSLQSAYIRLAHLLESGRWFDKFLDALDVVVAEKFKYRAVVRLPPECVAWNSRARARLTTTMVARDLNETEVDQILAFDNGDWDSHDLWHFCVPSCECAGREAAALAKAQQVARISLGSGMPVPLLYRFKHMEQAGAWVYRARTQHGILDAVLGKMFTSASRKRARAAAEAMLHQYFGYDPHEVGNPPGSHQPSRCCRSAHFGLCPTTDQQVFCKCQVFSANLHVLLKRWKITRTSFPVLVSLQVRPADAAPAATVSEYFFITDDIGKGDTQVLVRARVTQQSRLRFMATLGIVAVHGGGGEQREVVVPVFSQVALRDLLLRARAAAGLENVESIEQVSLSILAVSRWESAEEGEAARGFAALMGESLHSCDVSLRGRIGERRVAAAVPASRLPFGLLGGKSARSATRGEADGGESDVGAASGSDAFMKEARSSNSSASAGSASDSDADEADPGLEAAEGPAEVAIVVAEAAEEAVAAPPKAELDAYRPVGLFGFDKAPTGRAACWVCGGAIAKGAHRWFVRIKAVKYVYFDFRKYVHAACPKDARFEARFCKPSLDYLLSQADGAFPVELPAATIVEALLKRCAPLGLGLPAAAASSSGGGALP